jgi:hypothetical protein
MLQRLKSIPYRRFRRVIRAMWATASASGLKGEVAMAKDKPAHEIRLGRIKAVIWGNEIEGGGFRHNVQVRRIYKDGEEWKQSDSFGREDLPLVAKVADMAHTWIHQRSQDEA